MEDFKVLRQVAPLTLAFYLALFATHPLKTTHLPPMPERIDIVERVLSGLAWHAREVAANEQAGSMRPPLGDAPPAR